MKVLVESLVALILILNMAWTQQKNTTKKTLEVGRHTWPSGPQYMPKAIIGNVCRDIDAIKVIWDFFSKHPKQ